ncbi:MAG: outer membrane protein assembly factor BamE, partial [Burkholderiaceae bacterium]|nr:outer membrane protein assembly factor BamE [Burkholderiaceae bacterium]
MHTVSKSEVALFLPAALAISLLVTGCYSYRTNFLGESMDSIDSSQTRATEKKDGQLSPRVDDAPRTALQRLVGIVTPYRVDIQQGNFVSSEVLSKVKEGMTKGQVRFALGTPLLTDIFHADRWDYTFRLQKPDGRITNNRVIVYFKANRVSRILNDPLPNEADYLSIIAGKALPQKQDETKPTAPAVAEPVKPAVAEPVKPAVAEPVKPAVAEPVKPAV